MLHELLLALLGFDGDVFVRDESSGLFKVSGVFPSIHESEVALLNRICQLGGYYRIFDEFVKQYSRPTFVLNVQQASSEEGYSPGLYLKALAGGLDEALEEYRQTVLKLEKMVLRESNLPLTQLEHHLDQYQMLFPALRELLEVVKVDKVHGCQLLSLLDQRRSCGIPCVEKTMTQLQFACNGVFYHQLSAWMLHGELVDQWHEFFIKQDWEKKPDVVASSQEDTKEADHGPESTAKAKKVTFMDNKEALREKHEQVAVYSVDSSLLPVYIPIRLAEKIFFCGEAVHIFNKDPSQHNWEKDTYTNILSRAEETRFATLLGDLKKKLVFSQFEFESVIDTIRDHVGENLWKLIVEDADLVGHLQTVKDFYLLGRGELFLCFIDQAQDLLRKPVTGTSQHDANVAFQQSMTKVGIDDESITKHFSLTLPPSNEKKATDGYGVGVGWSTIGLSYKPAWPLQILFTPKILDQYNILFKFLLNARRVQMALHHAWSLQMRHKERAAALSSLWQLRTHMAFLIDNLQYYIQVDVLESQFSLLLENITSTLDFESIKLAHENFVSSLLGQLFFSMLPVSSCLNDILAICTSFCAILHSSNLSFVERDKAQINMLSRDFNCQSTLLFRLLSGIKDHQYSPHLAQMMLRIDFNKYSSSSGAAISPFSEV